MAKLRGNRSVSYSRVSSNSEQQKSSIEAQKAYYADKSNMKGYEVAQTGVICSSRGKVTVTNNGIYADEGISGTSLKYRKAFNMMIEDAKAGKFDIIFVKSFSRYARSTIDGLKTCEELRDIGVGVFFEDYNICSISEDKDFELALFFSLAQKESQTKSYNVKWGLRQRQKSGKWRGTAPYGYIKDENGEFQPDTDSRKIEAVNLMVDMYLDGVGVSSIVQALRDGKYPTYGRGDWCATHIRNMLKQDLYNGHYYTHTLENATIKDHSKKIYIPKEDQIHIELPHCKIIDDDRWGRVQAERNRREKLFKENGGYRERKEYLFSNLVYCECGCAYRPKIDNRPSKNRTEPLISWKCTNWDKYAKSANCPNMITGFSMAQWVIEDRVKEKILELKTNKDYLLKLFMIKELVVTGLPLEEGELEHLQAEKSQIEDNIKKILFRAGGGGGGGIYEDMLTELETDLRRVKNRIEMQSQRERIIKEDKLTFDRYIKDLENVDIDNLTNAVLKRLFYKIHIVNMEKHSDLYDKPQRGIMFDYYFLQMPYSELVEKALDMGYPHPEDLTIEIIPF